MGRPMVATSGPDSFEPFWRKIKKQDLATARAMIRPDDLRVALIDSSKYRYDYRDRTLEDIPPEAIVGDAHYRAAVMDQAGWVRGDTPIFIPVTGEATHFLMYQAPENELMIFGRAGQKLRYLVRRGDVVEVTTYYPGWLCIWEEGT